MLGLGLQLPRHQPIFQRFQGLLDLYPNAAFATDMRLLRADYSGGLLRTIAYDGASQQGAADIMPYKIGDNYWVDFNSKLENLDATAIARGLTTNDTLADLCSVGVNNYDGLVPSWYDQSLNANHATQTSLAAMPKLVDAGVLVEENGGPALDFDGVNDGLQTSTVTASFDNASLFVVSKNDVTSGQQNMVRLRPNGSRGSFDGISWEQGERTSTTRYSSNTVIEANGNHIHPSISGVGTQDLNQHLNTLLFNQSEIISYEDGVNDFVHNDIFSGSIPVGTVNVTKQIWLGLNIDRNNRGFNGKFQEVVLYFNSQSANRTEIESNINNAYNVYLEGFVGLLDEVSGADFATSMRLLRASYSGGLARVIAYDGASQQGAADIMPYKIGDNYWIDLNSKLENLDATATARGLTTSDTLADLCSVGVNNYDGLVTKHYDQVGSNDMEVTTISRMPRLVNAGVLETENGKPKLARVNDTTGMVSTYQPNSGTLQKSMLIVGQNSDTNRTAIFGSLSGSGDYGYFADLGSAATVINNNPTLANERRNGVAWNYSTRGNVYNDLLTQSVITNNIQFNFNDNSIAYGHRFDDNGGWQMINQQEMVIWEGTPNQIDIETNANNAYNIY